MTFTSEHSHKYRNFQPSAFTACQQRFDRCVICQLNVSEKNPIDCKMHCTPAAYTMHALGLGGLILHRFDPAPVVVLHSCTHTILAACTWCPTSTIQSILYGAYMLYMQCRLQYSTLYSLFCCEWWENNSSKKKPAITLVECMLLITDFEVDLFNPDPTSPNWHDAICRWMLCAVCRDFVLIP